MSDFYFGFLIGTCFALCAVCVLWALCEDYHQWRKRREAANASRDVQWINIPTVSSRKERTRTRKTERKPRRK